MELDRIIRLPELLQVTGLSSATLYRWIGNRRFPAPVKLGPNSVGWRESAVQAWMESLEQAEIRPGSDDEKEAAALPTRGGHLAAKTSASNRQKGSPAGAEASR